MLYYSDKIPKERTTYIKEQLASISNNSNKEWEAKTGSALTWHLHVY